MIVPIFTKRIYETNHPCLIFRAQLLESVTRQLLVMRSILVNERAGSLSSLGLDVLTKPNELSAQCALASRASLGIGARSVSLLSLVGWGGWKLGAEGLGGGAISR